LADLEQKIHKFMPESTAILVGGCSIRELEPGIIEDNILTGQHIDVEDIHQIREANLKLSGGNQYVVLVSTGGLSTISKEAMQLISAKDYSDKVMAKALLIENLGHRLVGNFYLRVIKPAMKTKIFTDREKALEWLREVIA
jgi:hypothetical protein